MGIVTYIHTGLLVSLIAAYFSAGVLSMRQGFRPARYYALAWSFLFLGILVYHIGQLTELLPNNIFIRYSVLWGSVFEFLLLSLALGDRYKLMRDESQMAVQKAANAQAVYAETLEAQVQERTLKLRNAMTQIETLARTDDLTQLLNRRAFNEILEKEVSRANRQNRGITFCILDIDDFKLYNDHYGHIAGDLVLRKIGLLIREQFRRPTDFCFRLGGEEFAVLVADIQLAQESATFFEQLRLGIESLKIDHNQSALGFVTASFGLVTIESCDSRTVNDLYREADEALYEAESAGKNQLVVRIHQR
jgi:diguanylate cyclase (GGDEF)-like protein